MYVFFGSGQPYIFSRVYPCPALSLSLCLSLSRSLSLSLAQVRGRVVKSIVQQPKDDVFCKNNPYSALLLVNRFKGRWWRPSSKGVGLLYTKVVYLLCFLCTGSRPSGEEHPQKGVGWLHTKVVYLFCFLCTGSRPSGEHPQRHGIHQATAGERHVYQHRQGR